MMWLAILPSLFTNESSNDHPQPQYMEITGNDETEDI